MPPEAGAEGRHPGAGAEISLPGKPVSGACLRKSGGAAAGRAGRGAAACADRPEPVGKPEAAVPHLRRTGISGGAQRRAAAHHLCHGAGEHSGTPERGAGFADHPAAISHSESRP